MSAKPNEIILHLVPLPDDGVPVAIRQRMLLKYALRGLRLRCTRIDGDTLAEPKEKTHAPIQTSHSMATLARPADKEVHADGRA